jgi:hypothetical protein
MYLKHFREIVNQIFFGGKKQMKLRKILAVLVAFALVGSFAISASARQTTLQLAEEDQVDGVATIVYYFSSMVGDVASGAIDGNVYVGLGNDPDVTTSVANEAALFTEQGKGIFLDEGQAYLRLDLGGTFNNVGGWVDINLWTVGSYGIDRYEFFDASGNQVATVKDGVVTLGGSGTVPAHITPGGGGGGNAGGGNEGGGAVRDTDPTKAGVGDAAVASAIALVAAGAVIFSRKKK